MAILFACQHPELNLVGLTSVFGNVTGEIAARNALHLIELAGQDVPVAKGAEQPLVQEPLPVADFVHGAEGFGHLPPPQPATTLDSRPAAEFICDNLNEAPGEIILCPIGPLTNIAQALERDPGIAEKVKGVQVMGASLTAGGNATPHAEANIWQDPHAAEVVLAASWDVTLVGLDVTHQVICTAEEFDLLAHKAPQLGGFLSQAARFYFDFHAQKDGIRGCYMHDALAVISIIRPGLFSMREDPVQVILDGERSGETQLSTNTNHPKVKWYEAVEAEKAKALFFATMAQAF